MLKQRINVVFYAINGTGLGHITRLNNIAEDAEEICSRMKIETNFQFLTTSDAPSVVTRFLSTKLPSKTTIKALNLPVRKTTALIKAQISNFIGLHSPDCLVLDTNPRGSYNEFSFLKSLARSTLFIDRHKKPETITRIVKNTIRLYDTVIVPEFQGADSSFDFHPNCHYVGKIHGFKPEKSLSTSAARNYFGVSDDELLVYLSSGGGGDALSQEVITQWVSAIKKTLSAVRIVIGYGPLYKGDIIYGDKQVIPCTHTNISKTFNGFDLAVSAAGYNSCEELLSAKVPSLFYALEKGLDDQMLRIRQYADEGYCLATDDIGNCEKLLELANRKFFISKKLGQRNQYHGSLYAAMHIIKNSLTSKNCHFNDVLANEIIESIIASREQCLIDNTSSAA